jgi:predicted NAD/FAD-binding protein
MFRFSASSRRLVHRWSSQFEDDEDDDDIGDISIGEYFKREGYSQSFVDNYFIVSVAYLIRSLDCGLLN